MLNRTPKAELKRPRRVLPPLSATVAATSLVVTDSVALLGCGLASYMALIDHSGAGELYATAVVFVWLISLILMHFAGLYRYDAIFKPLNLLTGMLVSVCTAYLFLLAAAYSIKLAETFSRTWFATFALSSIGALVLTRIGVASVLGWMLGDIANKRRIAVLGTGKQTDSFLLRLQRSEKQPFSVHGIYRDDTQSGAVTDGMLPPGPHIRGDISNLCKEARDGFIDDVVVALPWSEDQRILKAISKLRELPVNIYLGTDLIGYQTQFTKAPNHFNTLPIYQVVGKPMSGWDAVIKKVEDYVLGSLALLILSPILAIVAGLVWLDSGGPILFRQKRLGYNNEEFEVLKFRTMRHEDNAPSKTVQATKNDPRVTRIGRFLRRASLDELPQLFNVLGGTMSLVGPRPHALDHNDEFSKRAKDYFARHRVKPGITGLAQVKGFRGPTDTDEKLEGRIRNDNFYAENWSLSLDIQILFRTIIVCIFGTHAH